MEIYLVAVSDIRPSDNPVRSSFDEEAMDLFAEQVKNEGIITPVKLRIVDADSKQPYEIVYGHRRVEAVRRAGLKSIPAIIQDIDDETARRQQLIENVVREDMKPIDIARVLRQEIDELKKDHDGRFPYQEHVGIRYGLSKQSVSNYLRMIDYKDVIQSTGWTDLGTKHVFHAEAGAGGDKELAAKVLEKAAKEELSTRVTRQVAEAIADTLEDDEREALLQTPFDEWDDYQRGNIFVEREVEPASKPIPQARDTVTEKYTDYPGIVRKIERLMSTEGLYDYLVGNGASEPIIDNWLGFSKDLVKLVDGWEEVDKTGTTWSTRRQAIIDAHGVGKNTRDYGDYSNAEIKRTKRAVD